MSRVEINAETAREEIVGRKVDAVEIAGGSVIVRIGEITLYADAPTFYGDDED